MRIKLIILLSILFLISGCSSLSEQDIFELLENSCLKTNIQNVTNVNGSIILSEPLEFDLNLNCDNWEIKTDADTGEKLMVKSLVGN